MTLHCAFPLQVVLLSGCIALAIPNVEAAASDAESIRQIIDHHIQSRWEEEGVTPAPAASDAEFLRRVWLDLAGRVPPAGEVRAFLEDKSPDKRVRVTRELLNSSMYVEEFAEQWLKLLAPEVESDQQLAYVIEELRSWLRQQALKDVSYDDFVRSLLSVPLVGRGQGPFAYNSDRSEPLPTAFYAAKDTSPANLAAATARVFLGIRVDCAQCHDHPFAHWKQDEFWSYAAFYQGLNKEPNQQFQMFRDLFFGGAKSEVSILIPDTDRIVNAKFLGAESPDLIGKSPRAAVADWIVNADNPYFSRAMVNRTWGQLLGRGLIDPVDDMDSANPPSHPELLDKLAAEFGKSFDTGTLIEAIVLSAPYQRTSVRSHSTQEDPELFARFYPRRMTAAQVRNSIGEAFGIAKNPYSAGVNFNVNNIQFDRAFATSASPLERASSVQQSLLLMNGQQMANVSGPDSQIVRAWSTLPGVTEAARIDIVYLSILSRLPTKSERSQMLAHVRASQSLRHGLSDIAWALANSAEFIVNH